MPGNDNEILRRLDQLIDVNSRLLEQQLNSNYNSNVNNNGFRLRNFYSRGGYGRTFGDVREMRYDNQYYTKEKKALEELIAKLDEARDTGDFSAITEEDVELMEKYGASLNAVTSGGTEATESMNNLNSAVDSLGKKKYDTNVASRLVTINNLVNGIGRSLKNMDSSLHNFVKPWEDADVAASKYAKTVAMTKAGMDSLRDTTIKNVVHSKIGIDYNMSTDELLAAQQSYVQGVGRNLRIDNKGQESLAAMHAVMGGRENDLAVAFENFGVGLEKTGEHAGEMFKTAAKHGISFEKLTDNVAKNIKIAQNYTFKNGLKGLESMAAKAAALKMDMGQVAALADKVSSVEGAIGVASKLQVLGGPFASMADPLGMMSEGLMDMEGLMDRVTNMIGGLGNFNKATGQVEVSAFNKQRVKAAADAMGISYDQLMESVNAQAKRQEIEAQINKSGNAKGLNKDMQELIKNSATFNEEGKAGVSINGEFKTLDELSNDDYEELVKETQDESKDIKDIARNVRSLADIRSGVKKQKEANQAQMTGWLGKSMKYITDKVGNMNGLLKALVVAQGVSTGLDILGSGMDIVDMFRGGKGKRLGKLGNRLKGFVKKGKFGKVFNKASKALSKGKSIVGKFGNKLSTKATSKLTSKLGGNVTKNLSRTGIKKAGTELLGRAGANSITAVSNLGTKLSSKGFTKVGTALTQHASKQAAEYGMKNVAKMGGKKIAAKTAGKIGAKMAAGVAKGGVAGIVGAVGNIATDMLVEKGKIKKGGTAHTAMKVGSTALEGAALGAMIGSAFPGIGTAIGTAVGAIGGAVVGAVKMAKVKREMRVDNKLQAMGIERKGDYGARSYKLINKALDTGEISNRMRRKLEKNGDIAMLEAIDKKKKEKDEEKEAKKDRRAERWSKFFGGGKSSQKVGKAYITVTTAYFGGKAFGAEGFGNGEGGEENPLDKAKKLGGKLFGGFGMDMLNPMKAMGAMVPGLGMFNIFKKGGKGNPLDMLNPMNAMGAMVPGLGMFKLIRKLRKANKGEGEEDGGLGDKFSIFSKLGNFGMLGEKIESLKGLNISSLKDKYGLTQFTDFFKKFGDLKGKSLGEIAELIKTKPETGENPEVKKLTDDERNKANQKRYDDEQSEKERKRLEEENKKLQQEQQQPQPTNGNININITGTIKLVGANGQEADITKDLLKDDQFRKQLAQIIKDQLNENKYGNYIPQKNIAS